MGGHGGHGRSRGSQGSRRSRGHGATAVRGCEGLSRRRGGGWPRVAVSGRGEEPPDTREGSLLGLLSLWMGHAGWACFQGGSPAREPRGLRLVAAWAHHRDREVVVAVGLGVLLGLLRAPASWGSVVSTVRVGGRRPCQYFIDEKGEAQGGELTVQGP